MKVKVLMNKVSWDVSKELLAIKSWFSKYVDLDFEVEALCQTNIGWMGKGKGFKKFWVEKVIFDDSATIYVLNLPKDQWEGKGFVGLAPRFDLNGQYFIGMTSSKDGKRKKNKGWLNDNEFAGRLRHELCHIFYWMTGEDEKRGDTWKVHILEDDNINRVLKDIKWKNLKSLKK